MLEEKQFKKVVERKISLPYTVYLPENYSPENKYPLVVFLHGAGERGETLEGTTRFGFLQQAKAGKSFPFIIVAPLCPQERYWGNYLESLNDFLDEILATYAVDPARVYLTGLSMGGTGTWQWLMANPERFAAAAPVCGSGIYWYACRVANKPIWLFHGAEDTTVPVEESLNMYRALKKCGGSPKLTVYETVDHNAWDYAYNNELAQWFLQFKNQDL